MSMDTATAEARDQCPCNMKVQTRVRNERERERFAGGSAGDGGKFILGNSDRPTESARLSPCRSLF